MILVEDMVTKADFLRLLYKRHQFEIKGSEFFQFKRRAFCNQTKKVVLNTWAFGTIRRIKRFWEHYVFAFFCNGALVLPPWY